MSDQPAPSAPAPQPPADRPAADAPRPSKPHGPPKGPKPPKPRRGGALAVLALLLALVALAGVAFGAWQWWQWRQHRHDAGASVAQLQKQVADLRRSVASGRQQGKAGAEARQAMQAADRALRQRVDGLSGRVDSLDAAVASLARHQRDGREAMLLDQAGMLLRMGRQRYALFHDAGGAVKALELADQTLAAVHDPALSGVRRAIDAEREALVATHPASRAADLAALADLRASIATLPLKPLDADAGKSADRGFWSRVWQALSTAVVIRRDDGSVQNVADARLTRKLAALDVAEAQAARLAWDIEASRAALRRVAGALDTAFDADDPGVRKARAEVERLLAAKPASPPSLGKALRQLRALRGVRDAAAPAAAASTPAKAPASPASIPAPAGTSA